MNYDEMELIPDPDQEVSQENTLERIEEADENSSDSEFLDSYQVQSILESLLFASDRPVGLEHFKAAFKGSNIKTKEIKKALEEYKVSLAESNRGVELFQVAGGYQLRTKVDNKDYFRKINKARPFRLSGPALEVLSIVAYKQPCIKADIDEIRGVESGHLLRALMDKSLVRFAGKSELPGKPMMYQTSRKFLEIFGLSSLKDLPTLREIDELIPEGITPEDEKPKLADLTDDLSQSLDESYSKGEEELTKISDELSEISTSTDFFEEEKRRQRDKRERERAEDIREALLVGQEVDDKDQRWLERYEKKLEEARLEKEALENQAQEVNREDVLTSENPQNSNEADSKNDIYIEVSENKVENSLETEHSLSQMSEENSLNEASVNSEKQNVAESEEDVSDLRAELAEAAEEESELESLEDEIQENESDQVSVNHSSEIDEISLDDQSETDKKGDLDL